jgi:hypothetical protein
MKDNYFDLHYKEQPYATSIYLGLGHLWHLAVDNPHEQMLHCIRRAPIEKDGEYRLLLIC